MTSSPLTLICFAVKEEAASFKAAIASNPNSKIQILLTGMGQRNAAKSLRATLHHSHHSHPSHPSHHSTTPPLHQSTTPSLVLTCGFAGALNPDLSLGTVLFAC